MPVNNKGFAITSFLYSVLVVFMVVLSVLITNMINTKLTIEKLKQQVKEEIQDELVNQNQYLKLIAEPQEIIVTSGTTYDLYSGMSLFRYDNTKYMDEVIKGNMTIEASLNDSESYSLNYSVSVNGVLYKSTRILKMTDASNNYLTGQALTNAVNTLLANN